MGEKGVWTPDFGLRTALGGWYHTRRRTWRLAAPRVHNSGKPVRAWSRIPHRTSSPPDSQTDNLDSACCFFTPFPYAWARETPSATKEPAEQILSVYFFNTSGFTGVGGRRPARNATMFSAASVA